MGNQFHWHIDESEDERPSANASRNSARNFLITAALLTILVIGGWLLFRRQQESRTQTLIQSAQSTLELMQAAVTEGDGELFFALQDPGVETFAAQLTPQNLDFYRAGPQITNVEESGPLLHANATWQEDGQQVQRVLFFSQQGNQLLLVATDLEYWGASKVKQQSWGKLVLHERDEVWADEIARFITEEISDLCAASCLEHKLPVTVTIRSGFLPTAEPALIYVPSPRLLGLDKSGQPSDRFWQALEMRLKDYLTPARIRFAVPPEQMWDIPPRYFRRIDYQAAAEAFMAEHPDINIELLPFESLPVQPQELLAFDGAAYTPTMEMITAGQIVDLTPFMRSDPDFDPTDFYEQIWQGATWRDRLWMMPQAAQMPLMYYHRGAYQSKEQDEPLIGWTWAELDEDVQNLIGAEIVTGDKLTWGLLDQTFNTLYAIAFNNQSQCAAFESRPCPFPLTNEDIVAALEWYLLLTGEEGVMPDPSVLPPRERNRLLINSLFETAIWVDEPLYYEHRTAMFPMGVVPFPGSESFESYTPLWVTGSFISQESERPLAMWQWLKFLSRWPPMAHYRLVPARSSVSQEMDFWNRLPRELGEPMRAAFPLARPVRLQEQAIFSWPAIRAVMEGKLTPQQAAQQGRDFAWFEN
jgi:ABC-type glycerol-3-phosphate transport system substrate-binding protein